MKRLLILFFTLLATYSVHSQSNLQDGDRCFDNGDYSCAKIKYDEVFKLANGRDKQIAEIKLTRAKWCADHIKVADQAYRKGNYKIAIENFENVLESNTKDEYARKQIAKCKNILYPPIIKLVVSKDNLSFPSLGGNDSVAVTTNSDSYSINVLPYWCSIQKYPDYFVVNCVENSFTSPRTEYLTVSAGNKVIRVNISQLGASKPPIGSLRVTKENLIFSKSGGRSEAITVYSNTGSYSITRVPRWCTIEQNTDNFFVSCKVNKRKKIRSCSFKLSDGYNELIIFISQDGK